MTENWPGYVEDIALLRWYPDYEVLDGLPRAQSWRWTGSLVIDRDWSRPSAPEVGGLRFLYYALEIYRSIVNPA